MCHPLASKTTPDARNIFTCSCNTDFSSSLPRLLSAFNYQGYPLTIKFARQQQKQNEKVFLISKQSF